MPNPIQTQSADPALAAYAQLDPLGFGDFLRRVGRGIGSAATAASPFLPGPWGAVAGLGGGLLSRLDLDPMAAYGQQGGQGYGYWPRNVLPGYGGGFAGALSGGVHPGY